MNGSLKIDFERLNEVANKINNEADNFDTLLKDIKNASDNITGWTGSAAKSYTEEINKQNETMSQLTKAMHEISSYLTKISDAYKSIEDNYTIK